jgi:hypothetical protein
MSQSYLDEFSDTLIHDAENACAESDPDEIGDAAAMVLVGDVYALHVCRPETRTREQSEEVQLTDDRVSPFIR